MHIPGVKVVMPSDPYDAQGLLVASVNDGNPVIYIDDRWLYSKSGYVPKELYSVPIGKGVIRRDGVDVTVAATSYMVHEALRAGEVLEMEGIDIEVIDLRSLKPLDEELLRDSVKKTSALVIADGGWKTAGAAAEISARIAESDIFDYLKSPIQRVSLPDSPAPANSQLEREYYRNYKHIVASVKRIMEA